MSKEKEEIKFPLRFTKCPNCGSERRVVEVIKEACKQSPKPKQAATMVITPVGSKELFQLGVEVPWLNAALVICADCGTVYCIQVEVERRPPPSRGRA